MGYETSRNSQIQYGNLTRFRRTSEVDLIPGPEQGFDIVVVIFQLI